MNKARKRLTIIVTAFMLVFFAGSAFALANENFTNLQNFDGVQLDIVGYRVDDSNLSSDKGFSMVSGTVNNTEFNIGFAVDFKQDGDYVIVDFEVRNSRTRSVRITGIDEDNREELARFGVDVKLGDPALPDTARGLHTVGTVIPANTTGILRMIVQWSPYTIDWTDPEMAAIRENMNEAVVTFETRVHYEEVAPQTPTPPTTEPTGGPSQTPTPAPTSPPPTITIPPTNGGDDEEGPDEPTGGPESPDETTDTGDEEDKPDEPQQGGGAPTDEDNDDDKDEGPDEPTGGPGNPLTGDVFNASWLIISLVGFALSAIALVIIIVVGRKSKNQV